jgi:hypothetical protein
MRTRLKNMLTFLTYAKALIGFVITGGPFVK